MKTCFAFLAASSFQCLAQLSSYDTKTVYGSYDNFRGPTNDFNPSITIGAYEPLRDLPEANTNKLKLDVVAARLRFESGSDTVLSANLRQYAWKGKVRPFGPVLRINPGSRFSITLNNELSPYTDPPGTSNISNGFTRENTINIHTHGLHVNPGQTSPDTVPVIKDGEKVVLYGDNVFAQVLPGGKVRYKYDVIKSHLPGMHWYHPHVHGSTTIQTMFGAGVLIINEPKDLSTLLQGKNCGQVRDIMQYSKTYLLQVTGYFFRETPEQASSGNKFGNLSPRDPNNPDDDTTQFIEQATIEPVGNQTNSVPEEIVCCDTNTTQMDTNYFTTNAQDFVLVNGQYIPKLKMEVGKWLRVKLVNTMVMKWMDLTLRERGSTQWNPKKNLAGRKHSPCELMLVAKDGVYVPDLPRRVESLLMWPGSRVDVLVRCNKHFERGIELVSGRGPMGPLTRCRAVHCQLWGDEQARFPNGTVDYTINPQLNRNRGVLVQFNTHWSKNKKQVSIQSKAASSTGDSIQGGECKVNYPSYLDNKALKRPSKYFTHQLVGLPDAPEAPGACVVTYGTKGLTYTNEEPFLFPDPCPVKLVKNTAQRWRFENLDEHPMHVHVDHFRLLGLSKPCTQNTRWYRKGDFHDTLQLTCELRQKSAYSSYTTINPSSTTTAAYRRSSSRNYMYRLNNEDDEAVLDDGEVTVEFFASDFGGKCKKYGYNSPKKDRYAVLHCHYLAHEDEGCMKVMHYTCNETIPAACYTNATENNFTDYKKGYYSTPSNYGDYSDSYSDRRSESGYGSKRSHSADYGAGSSPASVSSVYSSSSHKPRPGNWGPYGEDVF